MARVRCDVSNSLYTIVGILLLEIGAFRVEFRVQEQAV